MKIRKLKKQLGITLIALVITIVVLIILAAVVINIALGKSGILSKSQQAKQETLNAQAKEQEDLNELYSKILVATNDSAQVTISVEDLKTLISNQVKEELKTSGTSSVPAGTVISYYSNSAPEGYLSCNGTLYNISDYSNLAKIIYDTTGSYGTTEEGKFAVPNLQGEFLRGTGTNTTTGYSGANVGIHQNGTDVVGGYFGSNGGSIYVGQNMYHTDMYNKADNWIGNSGLSYNYGSVSRHSETATYNSTIGKGTSRPTNTSVLYCIKY